MPGAFALRKPSFTSLVTSTVALFLVYLYQLHSSWSTSSEPASPGFILAKPITSTIASSNIMTAATMRAIVMHETGGPSVLKLQSLPRPTAKSGHVLIRIKAFGLNRSEVFTRQGHSPGVTFPRVLGIEAAGEVEDAPGAEFQKGDVVVTAMGGMGRVFDGGYAEYTLVPASQVLKVGKGALREGAINWAVLGALPEMMQTAWGSLFKSLQLERGDRLLIRGGTTSVGLAAAALAKEKGAFVAATTRNASRETMLKDLGIDHVIIDDGVIAQEVRRKWPQGFDKILELVGVTTLEDSLKCAAPAGTVCMTGIAGGKWTFDQFNPMMSIPTAVRLTTYAGSAEDLLLTPVDDIAAKVLSGAMKLPIKTFKMEDIVEAHRFMEHEGAVAKIVVLT